MATNQGFFGYDTAPPSFLRAIERPAMKLPNLSYMMSVGELRFIQSHFETGERCNPDGLVGMFLQPSERARCLLRGTLLLPHVRRNPFYTYVVARTKHYDEIFLDAAYRSFGSIINIGCGSDTRAYRFAHTLTARGVRVLECDQAAAIHVKRQVADTAWPATHVAYLAVDLNDETGRTEFVRELNERGTGPLLVMLEGVSPYVNADAFTSFLRLCAATLRPGSVVAYDFKVRGVADDFGRGGGSQALFRLTADRESVQAFHVELGFELASMELSAALTRRMLPRDAGRVFEEDCLLRLIVRPRGA